MKKLVNDKEVLAYLVVGILTEIVTMLVYYAITTILNPKIPLELQISNVLSWVSAVLFAFIANRRFVFKNNGDSWLKALSSFIGTRMGTLILGMLLMHITVHILGLNDKIMKMIVEAIVVVANYITSKFIVFR
jgi:putative cell wall teichoic acid glycosylation protein gtcA